MEAQFYLLSKSIREAPTVTMGAEIIQMWLKEAAGRPFYSDLDKQILEFLSMGKTNPQIAREIFIAQSTLKLHLKNIYKKLNVSNRTMAVIEAQKQGIIKIISVPI